MSSRSRLLDILTAAQLADKQLAQAQAAGQRDAQNVGAWSNLLTQGIGAGTQAIGQLQAYGDAREAEKAKDLVASNVGQVGAPKADSVTLAEPPKPEDNPVFAYEPPEQGKGPLLPTKPYEDPAKALTRDLKVTPGQPGDPLAPLIYQETPGEYAKRVVAESGNFKSSDDPFAFFTSGSRERARRMAEAQIAQQVQDQRAATDKHRFEAGKVLAEEGFKLADLGIKQAGLEQADKHFTQGEASKASEHNTQRTFETDEKRKDRDAAQVRAETIAAGQAAGRADARDLHNRLPEAERTGIRDFANALQGQDRLLGRVADLEAKGKEIGPTVALDKILAKFGGGDDEILGLSGDVTAVSGDYRKAMTGLGVSLPEIEETLITMPQVTDPPSRFREKAAITKTRVAQKIETQLGLLEADGYNTEGVRKYLAPLLRAAAPKPTSKPAPRSPAVDAPLAKPNSRPPEEHDTLDDVFGSK